MSNRDLDDLTDSIGDAPTNFGLDELDIDLLESEDEDLNGQDEYKGKNLKSYG